MLSEATGQGGYCFNVLKAAAPPSGALPVAFAASVAYEGKMWHVHQKPMAIAVLAVVSSLAQVDSCILYGNLCSKGC